MTAFVTGAAQGLGRAICVALAHDGHDVIACDLGSEDMGETIAGVEGAGRKIVAGVADVREQEQLDALVADGVAALGGLDVVVANAGISNWSRFWEMPDEQWQRLIDINLTGVWRTFKATAPVLIDQDRGGSMIAISSVAGIKSLPGQAHYSAASSLRRSRSRWARRWVRPRARSSTPRRSSTGSRAKRSGCMVTSASLRTEAATSLSWHNPSVRRYSSRRGIFLSRC